MPGLLKRNVLFFLLARMSIKYPNVRIVYARNAKHSLKLIHALKLGRGQPDGNGFQKCQKAKKGNASKGDRLAKEMQKN